MSCRGRHGDYYCPAWRLRAKLIRRRDHNRCRDCGRRGKLEVHHLWYAFPAGGPCGRCVLLAVPDEALISLCNVCHDIRHGRNRVARPAGKLVRFILRRLRMLF